ncbi:hypothetical protein D554_3551 [Bordetella holmesii 30539]|uniref:N-acetyltransferase YedL n=1 Tax=Bordetella holmesii 1058 TaxID=1247648 RepID=A0ABN0RYC4_9BORD|nr:hypothetical protein D558_3631 [Bordetella holmesii 44057]EWM41060.1 hypothetical protein D555_3705 [Bordetella holmesii 35009]EWM42390.1 hypothetical protein D556_3632 [Bordetella holmesii 41130]EXF88274.1 hypothetical protein D554_3551 [Bordetella holmesii 30539]EXX94276.1 hypothetical protein D559_1685 [Bordetella holmesii 1058]
MGDIADQSHDTVDGRDHGIHGLPGLLHLPRSGGHALARLLNQPLYLARRLGAALRQRAHLSRHHRETLALLAGSGCFHGGIERQNVGLKSNAVNHADDFADACRRGGNPLHALDGVLHGQAAIPGQTRRTFGLAAGQVGIASGLADGIGQASHAGSGFLQDGGLSRGTIGHVARARRDLTHSVMNRLHTTAHTGHRLRQSALHASHGRIENPDFVVTAVGDSRSQVAVGDALEMPACLRQGAQDRAPKGQPDHQCQGQNQKQQSQCAKRHPVDHQAGLMQHLPSLLACMGLIDVDRADIALRGGGQDLVAQLICLDAIPAFDGRCQRP